MSADGVGNLMWPTLLGFALNAIAQVNTNLTRSSAPAKLGCITESLTQNGDDYMTYIRATIFTAVLAATCGALTGCASISKDECAAGNWQDIGYRDGANGETRGILADYANVCAGHGLGVDRGAYLSAYETGLNEFCAPGRALMQGRRGADMPNVCAGRPDYIAQYDLGVSQYCTPDNGYERGLSGNRANRVCSGPQHDGYRSGYYEGRTLYDAEQERLRLIEVEHDRLHDGVRNTKHEIRCVRSRLESGSFPPGEIRRLEKKLGRLEERLRCRIKDLRAFERGNGLEYCY